MGAGREGSNERIVQHEACHDPVHRKPLIYLM
jgi:hypothetical protein